ncbi:hypothetical protein CPB83DRAFT_849591 [Crepidotus variabilis]|uniref:F-box domain-containing protein n=1 Tax=Crepidotus variabilis TaxID=179855 RepID=A0A9P6JSD7_9AGAR|nr:hypothetical protein CPB83DRAFT_849591 [Crepidotus variabilis]
MDIDTVDNEPSSTIPFISIYDVLLLICEELERCSATPKVDLISASFVCKAFLEPAMTVLWRTMSTLLPLLKVIPNFTEGEVNDIVGPISLEALDKFSSYARRIRQLHNLRITPVNPMAWFFLSQSHTGPLLPGLKSLRFDVPKQNLPDFRWIFTLASPSLVSIHMSKIETFTEKSASQLLQILINKAPFILDLFFSGFVSSTLLNLLGHSQTIKSVQLFPYRNPDFHLSSLRALSHIPTLDTLSLALPISALQPIENSGEFSNLRTLSIHMSVTSARAFFKSYNLPLLSKLTLGFTPDTLPSDIDELLPHLLNDLPLLSHFGLSFWETSRGHLPDLLFPKPILHHFFDSSLRSIVVRDYVVPFEDGDPQNWYNSNLRSSLEVLLIKQSPHRQAPTLESLRTLAMTCPHLQQLELCMDLPAEIEFPRIEAHLSRLPPLSHPLAELYIGRTNEKPLPDAIMLAALVSRYVDHLFPKVEVMAGTNMDVGWCKGVNAMLRNYRNMRAARSN